MPELVTAIPDLEEQGHNERQQVRLGDLVDRIAGLLGTYTLLPHSSLAVLIACWIANTYTYKEFRYCGYLALRSAIPRSGKTRLLKLIGQLSKDSPKPTTLPTAAVLYRVQRDVLLLDEVDRLRNHDRDTYGDVMGILNVGFEQDGTIERACRIGDADFTVKAFPVYGPKAFAGIESLTDTLADRSFIIQMTRCPQRMPRLNMRRMASEFEAIRASLATWADQNREKIRLAYEDLPNEVPDLRAFDDRLQDIAEPLFVLANLADGERQEGPQVLPALLGGLREVAGGREPSSRERGLFEFLAIAKRCLGPDAGEQFIPSSELVRECELTDGLGWINGAMKLAGFLRHFDLTSRHSADGGCRGYLIKREWVQQWERILNQDQEAV